MLRSFLLFIALAVMAFGFACGGGSTPRSGDTPTEAYKRLFAAVKSKNTEAIKKELTKKSIEFGAMAAARQNSPVEKLYENGFTATTFSETLPTIRDERIKDDMGAVEVWNTRESKWEDLPFINEEGSWKLAVGDLFAGSFQSPGRGLDSREKEAANALANTKPVQPVTNVNQNTAIPSGPTVDSKAK